MSQLPAHASPVLSPRPPSAQHDISRSLEEVHGHDREHTEPQTTAATSLKRPLPPILTPAITPPPSASGRRPTTTYDILIDQANATASNETPHDNDPNQPEQPVPVSAPDLLPVLPKVTCQVRARIPTTVGQEMWLHLYHNDADDKEHLAIVFGPSIRSKSLDAVRPGETERDRMIRGAYTGRLYPGRTDSRVSQGISRDGGVRSAETSGTRGLNARDHTIDDPLSSRNDTVGEKLSDDDDDDRTIPADSSDGSHQAPLVRIHSECYTGETVWSARCDCGEQLDQAARLMSEPNGTSRDGQSQAENNNNGGGGGGAGGVIIYLRQEGRGIGLLSKLKAYNLQDLGHDTVMANLLLRHPADARSYGLATAMLLDLGLGRRDDDDDDDDGDRHHDAGNDDEQNPVNRGSHDRGIRLLTNNPDKVRAVEGPNREIRVAERVPMIPLAWSSGGANGVQGPEIDRYISTKIEKFKHMFTAA